MMASKQAEALKKAAEKGKFRSADFDRRTLHALQRKGLVSYTWPEGEEWGYWLITEEGREALLAA